MPKRFFSNGPIRPESRFVDSFSLNCQASFAKSSPFSARSRTRTAFALSSLMKIFADQAGVSAE